MTGPLSDPQGSVFQEGAAAIATGIALTPPRQGRGNADGRLDPGSNPRIGSFLQGHNKFN
jgi:hypothetical protein